MATKRAYGGELERDRRQLILDAAAACITEFGIEGSTMKRIASRAGVSTGMIAYYFKDKDELMVETLSNAAAMFRVRLNESAGSEPGLKRLQQVFSLSFAEKDDDIPRPWPLWLAFAAESKRNAELRTQLIERISTVRADMLRCCSAASEQGDLGPFDDSRLAADMLLALYHGLGTLTTIGGNVMSAERAHQIQAMALELLAGIVSTPKLN